MEGRGRGIEVLADPICGRHNARASVFREELPDPVASRTATQQSKLDGGVGADNSGFRPLLFEILQSPPERRFRVIGGFGFYCKPSRVTRSF